MAHDKTPYFDLYNSITKVIDCLIDIQGKVEDMYIEDMTESKKEDPTLIEDED